MFQKEQIQIELLKRFCNVINEVSKLKKNANYNLITAFLENDFFKLKQKNPSYSLRAYAQKIGVAPSALSELLNSKRTMTKNTALKIANNLGLDAKIKSQWLMYFSKPESPSKSKRIMLNAKQFTEVSDWFYFAILSLMNLDDFKGDEVWISKRLNLDLKLVHTAVQKMLQLKMIEKNKDGQWRALNFYFETPDGISSAGIKNYHSQTLEKAKHSIHQHPIDLRNFYSTSLAIDPRKIPEAKRRMKVFFDSMSEFLETSPKTEVYSLSMQLFPLTEVGK